MLGKLENSFHVLCYLLLILRDYVKDRSLLYETLEGERRMEITSGVAQGSILGSYFRTASYDSLLKLDMPEQSRLVGYADDCALVAGRNVEQAQSRLGIIMGRVSGWMTAHGFSLAVEKNRSASHIDRRVDYRIKTSGQILLTSSSKLKQQRIGLQLENRGLKSANGECWGPYIY